MAILSQEEKVACSDLFYAATGVRHDSHKWNASAALLLYEYIGKIKHCSKAFAFITNLPPLPSSKISSIGLYKVGKYIYELWEDFRKINNGEYGGVCKDFSQGYGNYPREIEIAIIFGG
jgi:hypothetical protein